jgi:flagellar protein FlbB
VAGYRVSGIIGRIIVLLLLILIMTGGGIIWFDYLNLIDAKTVLAPLYRFIGREGRTQPELAVEEPLSLDAARLTVRLEALELQRAELEAREQELQNRYGELEQMAQELEERQKALEDQEKSFNALRQEADDKERNVEAISQRLTGMPPEGAVNILNDMDDQLIIDVLRKTEEIAQAEGAQSIVPYWLSLMARTAEGAARAAELQRKMAGRPSTLN